MTESKARVGEDFIIVRNQTLYFSEYVGTLERENRELRSALQSWIDFEDEQIEKEGPYVGSKINELISAARRALENKGGGNG